MSEIVRSPKLEEADLNDLKNDATKTFDEQFQRLYRSFCVGKLTGVLTRVNIEKIYPGTYKRLANGSVAKYDSEADKKHIDWMAYDIRRGHRPILFLYKGIFGETTNGFVCSDDVVAYQAYRYLGIHFVPAIVLGRPIKLLDESGIGMRVHDGREKFESLIAIERKSAATFLGPDNRLAKCAPLKAIMRVKLQCERAAVCIKAFHIKSDPPDEIHYHHCLHSVAFRLVEVLAAVELLVKNGLAYQIRPLVRSAYELFLNFYIDWLSPERIGLLLQGVAQLSRIERDHPDYADLKDSIWRAFGGLADVCRNVADKGRLSPLGAGMHSQIYSTLSPVVHQDFGVTHEYANTLELGRQEKMDRKELLAHIRCLDLITAATVTRLLDDVGSSGGRPKEWDPLSPSRLRWVAVRRPQL